MTTFTPYNALRNRLEANWNTTPIGWVNEGFDWPNPPVPFIFADVMSLAASQITIGAPGNNLFREQGALNITVFVPLNSGQDLARQYATTLATFFRAKDFNGVVCRSPRISHGRVDDVNGNWFRIDVFCPFHYDLYA